MGSSLKDNSGSDAEASSGDKTPPSNSGLFFESECILAYHDPRIYEVMLGGGHHASSVTITDHRAGKFEAKFHDKILQEEISGVKGHFGPINALAFNPDGKRCLYQVLRAYMLSQDS